MDQVHKEGGCKLQQHQSRLKRRVAAFGNVIHLHAYSDVRHKKTLQQNQVKQWVQLCAKRVVVQDGLFSH